MGVSIFIVASYKGGCLSKVCTQVPFKCVRGYSSPEVQEKDGASLIYPVHIVTEQQLTSLFKHGRKVSPRGHCIGLNILPQLFHLSSPQSLHDISDDIIHPTLPCDLYPDKEKTMLMQGVNAIRPHPVHVVRQIG